MSQGLPLWPGGERGYVLRLMGGALAVPRRRDARDAMGHDRAVGRRTLDAAPSMSGRSRRRVRWRETIRAEADGDR